MLQFAAIYPCTEKNRLESGGSSHISEREAPTNHTIGLKFVYNYPLTISGKQKFASIQRDPESSVLPTNFL